MGVPRENGIPFAGMATAARSSQQTKYRSQTVFPRLLSIPANQIPFSFGSVGVCSHPSERNTVLTCHRPVPDCVSGDSARARLCIWRHPAGQTVPPATAPGPDCASGDILRVKLCLRRHPARQTVSPTTTSASFSPLVVAGGTVCGPDCRRRHSLRAGLLPSVSACGQIRTLGAEQSRPRASRVPIRTLNFSRVPILPLNSSRVPIRPLFAQKQGFSGRISTLAGNSGSIRTLGAGMWPYPHSRGERATTCHPERSEPKASVVERFRVAVWR